MENTKISRGGGKSQEVYSPSEDNKYTNDDLKIMQGWSLERKIQVTQTRIVEWYKHYEGKVYVSFSGGKDSTVLLDLARRAYHDIPAVFIDTGLEYPELREFVNTIGDVVWIRPEMNFKEVIKSYGYPIVGKEISQVIDEARRNATTGKYSYRIKRLNGELVDKNGKKSMYNCEKWKFLMDAPFLISNKCCNVMKKKPAKKYEKETGRKPIIGTMACESQARKTAWKSHGCNAFDGKRPSSQPLSFWTEQDIFEYLVRFKIPYASVYGEIQQDENGKWNTTGCERTGCVFCAFGCHLEKEPNRFQRLHETHPKLWNYCMKPIEEGGLGMKEVLEYIGVKIK